MNTSYIGVGLKETIELLSALLELGLIKSIKQATKQYISVGDHPFVETNECGPFEGRTFFSVRIDNKVYSMTHHQEVQDGKDGQPQVVQVYKLIGEKELEPIKQ